MEFRGPPTSLCIDPPNLWKGTLFKHRSVAVKDQAAGNECLHFALYFSRLVWRKFVATTWDYISQLSTSKQNPIRCYYVTAGDITLSKLGRTACVRPAGAAALCALLPLLPRGVAEVIYFQTTSQEEAQWEDDGLGRAVKTGRRRRRWPCTSLNACAGPGARPTNRSVTSP